jgi:hypothetical protein
MKGMGKANTTAAATRQLLDDLSYARLRAMKDRTPVYVVFAPPGVGNLLSSPPGGFQFTDDEKRELTNLVSLQYTGYALLALRSVGDQPGQSTPRYLTRWKSLPDGVLIPPDDFKRAIYQPDLAPAFSYRPLPFPKARKGSPSFNYSLPHLVFDEKGQLANVDVKGQAVRRDIPIRFVRGSIFFQRDAKGQIAPASLPDVATEPAKPRSDDYHWIQVNWVTGRAKSISTNFNQTAKF